MKSIKQSIKHLVLVSSFGMAVSGMAAAETVTIPVPKSLITDTVNVALSGVKIKVDNYGSKKGTSWLSQQSYVQFPTGQKQSFDIPESKFNIVGKRHLKHYVNELNSSAIKVSAPGDKLTLTLNFESEGEEVKGKCVRKKLTGGYKECSLKMERDIHVNKSKVEISVKPVVYKDSLSFASPDAKFTANVSIPNKLCKLAKGICGKIENKIYGELKSKLESNIEQQLGKQKLKNMIANKVRSALSPFIKSDWKIKNVSASGSKFLIKVERPDTINHATVSISAFKVKQANATMSCPGKVPFSATINTKTKVSGKTWMELENGSKTKKLNWNMNAKGSASSTLNRSWQAKGYNKKHGWARLVVQYKGSNGKNITKKSGKVNFARTCSKGMHQLSFK